MILPKAFFLPGHHHHHHQRQQQREGNLDRGASQSETRHCETGRRCEEGEAQAGEDDAADTAAATSVTSAISSTATAANANTTADASIANQTESEVSSLVELTSALRGMLLFRRNGYVLVDTDRELLGGRENKIVGRIVGVVLGGKQGREWRGMEYWPEEFGREMGWNYGRDEEEDEDGVRMPEGDDDED